MKKPYKPSTTLPKRQSQLESLPTELLEEIFMQSLNLSLPRASRPLSLCLSSSLVKRQLVFKAFSSSSGNSLKYSHELLDILGTEKEIAKLQSAILRVKWMTLDFLQKCIPIFLVTTLLQQFSSLNLDCKQAGQKISEAAVTDFVKRACEHRQISTIDGPLMIQEWKNWEAGEKGNAGKKEKYVDLQIGVRDGLINLHIYTPDEGFGTSDCPFPLHYRWRILFCLDECRIPEKLLHGPWTDERCEFLEMVSSGGASIDWTGSTSGEVAQKGLRDALDELNERAVDALVEGHCIPPVKRWRGNNADHYVSFSNSNENLARARNHSYPTGEEAEPQVYRRCITKQAVGVLPQTEDLKMLILRGNFSEGIIRLLLYAKTSIDYEDSEVIGWAIAKRDAGDERGIWLLEELFERDQYYRGPTTDLSGNSYV